MRSWWSTEAWVILIPLFALGVTAVICAIIMALILMLT